MADRAPHLDLDTPDPADSYPSTESSYHENGNANASNSFTVDSAKKSMENSVQSAYHSLQNQPATQNMKDQLRNGPVAQNVKEQTAKASAEFRDLAGARRTPDTTAATGQPLTHYHSFFYRLLSWQNPRATAISFAGIVLFIFAARFLNIVKYIFKLLYIVLGITASAEIFGKVVFKNGFASQMRPRKYFIVPKASLERFTDDLEQLINFFCIEFQRIVFAENILITAFSFVFTLFCYGLISFLPLWGLSVILTCFVYLGPLIYIKNKEAIDAAIQQGGEIASEQWEQVKEMAAQQTNRATSQVKTQIGEYSHKAQEIIARRRSASPELMNKMKRHNMPDVPTHEPLAHEPQAITAE